MKYAAGVARRSSGVESVRNDMREQAAELSAAGDDAARSVVWQSERRT